MKALAFVAFVAASAACFAPPNEAPGETPPSVGDALRAYVADADVGRRALEASLVNPDNGYSRLRLAKYTREQWGALDEHAPPTLPMSVDRLDPPAPDAAWRAGLGTEGALDDAALLELGRRAFFEYPVQFAPTLPRALASADHAGVWSQGGSFATVWSKQAGGIVPAYTCATCHAALDAEGTLVVGRNNPELDAGRIAGDGEHGPRWGLGRVDVTGGDGDNPVAITDLRPLRWQKRLHHAATWRHSDDADGAVALAVRIETLIITSLGESVRPPRAVAAGLALFLRSLANPTPRSRLVLDGAAARGRVHFERVCVRCHVGEGAAGEGVALAEVGTDARVGESSERGTGMYRAPSLRHVGDRRRLFASGEVDDVVMLLDADRRAVGHPFGLELGEAERAELVAYLRQL